MTKARINPFLLPLDRIPDEGVEIEASSADHPELADLLARLGTGDGVPATGSVRLFVRKWPRRVDIEGEVTATLPQICSRGLDPYAHTLQTPVQQILFRSPGRSAPVEELELTAEDLDRSELIGDELRLLEIVEEELTLALPMRPLCVTPCEGPCPSWGRDVPLTEPEKTDEPDPRWAALAGLKLKK